MKLSRELARKDMHAFDLPQVFVLTDRDRGLISWALRKTLLELGFHNERMKQEVRDLANRIKPGWFDA